MRAGGQGWLQSVPWVLGPLLLLALHAVGPWGPEPRGPGGPDPRVYGIDATRWMGAWRWAWLGLAAAAMLHPWARARLSALVQRAFRAFVAPRRPRTDALLALALAAFLFGQASRTFYGDGLHLLERLTQRVAPVASQALDLLAHDALYGLLVRAGAPSPAWTTYALLSVLAGVAYVAAARRLGRDLPADEGTRALVVVALLSTGAVQLFFAYAESYALVTAALAWAVALAATDRGARRTPVAVGLVTGLAIALHLLALAALPALAWWLARVGRSRRWTPALGGALSVGLAPAATLVAVWGLHAQGPLRFAAATHPGGANRRMLLPLVQREPGGASLASWSHTQDVLNLALLVAPVLLPALVLGLARRPTQRVDPALALLAGGFGALLVLWEPDMGGALDWDLFGATGLPLSLLAACGAATRLEEDERADAAGLWALAGLACTGPWVAGNALGWPC